MHWQCTTVWLWWQICRTDKGTEEQTNRQNENIMPLLSSLVWRRHKNETTENTLLTTTECKHKTTHSNYMTHKCAPTRNISQQHHSDSAANRVASAWCAARGTLSGSSLNFPNNTPKHTVFFLQICNYYIMLNFTRKWQHMHSLLLCDAYAYRELQKTTENIYVSNGL